jgi:hypothetical protein
MISPVVIGERHEILVGDFQKNSLLSGASLAIKCRRAAEVEFANVVAYIEAAERAA